MITECIEPGCNDLTDSISGCCESHEAQARQRLGEIECYLSGGEYARIEAELQADGVGLGAC